MVEPLTLGGDRAGLAAVAPNVLGAILAGTILVLALARVQAFL